ncbi:hypothetical protein KC338_g263 [Hortaea werneckii]|nr:hypothetical protein KC338_g263 [Hortaea werneckii]
MKQNQQGSGQSQLPDLPSISHYLYQVRKNIWPVLWEFKSSHFCHDERILKSQPVISFVQTGIQESRPNDGFVVFGDSVQGGFTPVLVDAVFELDDGQIAELQRQTGVELLRACLNLSRI